MTTKLSQFFLLIVVATTSYSDEPPPLSLFALPKVELRPTTNHVGTASPIETGQRSQLSEHSEPTDAPATEDFSLTKETVAAISESSISSFESMNGGSVLTAPIPSSELGGAAGWLSENVWDPVFAPEVVKVGKVYMSGGVVAAVKRKNPFCLLHPLVFVASW